MKIGLPSALIHFFYRPFWKTFFEELGLEVLESGETTKRIVDMGVKNAVPELCVPVKIYLGHVLKLVEMGADWVYIPRMMTIRAKDTFCPKFLGLPDMIVHSFPSIADKVLTHQIRSHNEDIAIPANYYRLGRLLGGSFRQVRRALRIARKKWKQFRKLCFEGYNCAQAEDYTLKGKKTELKEFPIKIGVIGYVYNVYDKYISMDVIRKLESLHAGAVTFEMIQLNHVERQLAEKLRKDIFWTFSNKLLAAGYHFYEDPTIDGIIHVTAFGCGPDSFLGKILDLDSDHYAKPYMTVRVDEHTGESHLLTRVEAFVDMIARKKRETGGEAQS